MIRARHSAAALALIALVTCATLSCSDNPESPPAGAGSCAGAQTDVCVDYTGTYWNYLYAQNACTTGTFSTDACTATNRVGTCTVSAGATTETKRRYYSPTYTVPTATTDCTNNYTGTFVAG